MIKEIKDTIALLEKINYDALSSKDKAYINQILMKLEQLNVDSNDLKQDLLRTFFGLSDLNIELSKQYLSIFDDNMARFHRNIMNI
jgi:hypothetical protein